MSVDALLDYAAESGWRAEWRPCTPPSTQWRAALVRPSAPALVAFGVTRDDAAAALIRRLHAPQGDSTVPPTV